MREGELLYNKETNKLFIATENTTVASSTEISAIPSPDDDISVNKITASYVDTDWIYMDPSNDNKYGLTIAAAPVNTDVYDNSPYGIAAGMAYFQHYYDGSGTELKSITGETHSGSTLESLTINGSTYNIPQGTSYSAGNGISINNSSVSVKAKANGGVTVDSSGVSVDTSIVPTINSNNIVSVPKLQVTS